MTAHHYLSLVAFVMVLIGWGARVYAEDNVTIYGAAPSSAASAAGSSSSSTPNSSTATTTTNPHKHHHKSTSTPSSSSATAATSSTAHTGKTTKKNKSPAATPATTTITVDEEAPPPEVTTSAPLNPAPLTITKSTPASQSQLTISAPAPASAPLPPLPDAGGKPEVDTGLPIARPGSKTYHMATFPLPPVIPVTTAAYGQKNLDEFPFSNIEHAPKNSYPWKLNIVTTVFWIGEDQGNAISSTTNVKSAWDEDWRDNNGGTDTPNARDGFAPARHAATINPFYVALPFNDLAFPDKARRWLPSGWSRPPRNGKPVSACQHRWVEIKNAQGDVCYAQWEDVGPLRYDHAEYVFGDERPDTYTNIGLDRAGLDVSPAVADYLGINDRNHLTRWRFVDDADVQPGAWLKYDEEALLFKAIRDSKDSNVLPIERARAPINDQDDIDANQKKVSKAKG